MTERILVVNADDLGFSADMNAAIQEGHNAGRITNATLMVDGEDIAGALAVIRECPNLGIGLHLDLCPLSGLYEMPYSDMRRNLQSPQMQSRVAEEVERQIQRFRSFGLEFTHMDGHRHFHGLPEIFEIVVDVAVSHGMRTMRLTQNWILPRTPSVYWDDSFHASALRLMARYGVTVPDNFLYGASDYSAASCVPGVNELMVHVGHREPAYIEELRRLLASEPWGEMAEAGIRLCSYPELARRQALRAAGV